ncbi:MAG: translocation/assembly module TamB domain-containing protein [Pyrinomonadaceae bacterium]
MVESDRITVQNINGRVKFTSNAAQVESLVGTLGGGRVEVVSGGALLEGLRPVQYRAVVRGRDVTVPIQGVQINRRRQYRDPRHRGEPIIDGTITLRRAEYTEDIDLADLINRRREASLQRGTGGGTSVQPHSSTLQVVGNDALVIRNNLADVVSSANLRLRGSVEEPIISGRISATRGTVVFRDDRYDLTRAS